MALLAIGGSGCAIASLASLGNIAGMTATAVSTGSDVYHLGKLDTAMMARYGDTIAAVRDAAADLRLRVCCDHPEAGDDPPKAVWKFEISDDVKDLIHVRIERRTELLSRCRVDVGWFGSEPTARLLMKRIRMHLPKTSDAVDPKNDGEATQ
jgi:hypothetical protein